MKKLFSASALIMTLCMGVLIASIAGGLLASALAKPALSVAISGTILIASILADSKKGVLNVAFTQGLCQKIQTGLNNILGSNSPSLRRSQVGYLQALQSPQNLAGVTKIPINDGTGKKKSVRLTYVQRATEGDLSTTENTDCSTSVERTPFEDDIAISLYLRTPGLKFDENNMRLLCQPDSEYMQTVINGEIDALVKNLNKKLLTIQLSNFGAFNPAQAGNKKSVILLTGQKKTANYNGESEIEEAFENVDSPGRPIVVGGGNLSHYVRQVGIGCCNEQGINMAQAGNMDYFRDRFVEGIIGTDNFIGLVPGMVQLLTWNKYVGVYRKENDVFSHSTIMDPVTGLTFDMKVKYNDCDDTWALHFGVWYGLYFVPDNAFNSADELYGVNGSFNFVGTLETDYCC